MSTGMKHRLKKLESQSLHRWSFSCLVFYSLIRMSPEMEALETNRKADIFGTLQIIYYYSALLSSQPSNLSILVVKVFLYIWNS